MKMEGEVYCKVCNIKFSGQKCPICGNYVPAKEALGRMIVFDVEKSILAKELGLKLKGDYAIKTR